MHIEVRYFLSATELQTFVNTSGLVNTIVSITFDATSGQYVLFFT